MDYELVYWRPRIGYQCSDCGQRVAAGGIGHMMHEGICWGPSHWYIIAHEDYPARKIPLPAWMWPT